MKLVSNVAEAMPNGGRITITSRNLNLDASVIEGADVQTREYILFEISDNGMGISNDNLKKIFEPFYMKKVMGKSGTGLGLAVLWGTVMDHHGYIDVNSDGNNGSNNLFNE